EVRPGPEPREPLAELRGDDVRLSTVHLEVVEVLLRLERLVAGRALGPRERDRVDGGRRAEPDGEDPARDAADAELGGSGSRGRRGGHGRILPFPPDSLLP